MAWIPFFGTVVSAAGERTVIATIILPVKDDAEAQKTVESAKQSRDGSGNLTLSFTRNGKTYTYTYKKMDEGLVLEK